MTIKFILLCAKPKNMLALVFLFVLVLILTVLIAISLATNLCEKPSFVRHFSKKQSEIPAEIRGFLCAEVFDKGTVYLNACKHSLKLQLESHPTTIWRKKHLSTEWYSLETLIDDEVHAIASSTQNEKAVHDVAARVASLDNNNTGGRSIVYLKNNKNSIVAKDGVNDDDDVFLCQKNAKTLDLVWTNLKSFQIPKITFVALPDQTQKV